MKEPKLVSESESESKTDEDQSPENVENTGLTQHAVVIDVYAKVLTDNLNALVCMGVGEDAVLILGEQHCNRAYAGACWQRLLPRLVMGLGCLVVLLQKAFGLLGANSHKRRPGRKSARPNRHVKPHPNMAYKG